MTGSEVAQEAIENKQEEPKAVEGFVQTPNMRVKTFITFSALTDFCKSFSIDTGSFHTEVLNGQRVYVLTYPNMEQ